MIKKLFFGQADVIESLGKFSNGTELGDDISEKKDVPVVIAFNFRNKTTYTVITRNYGS